MFNLASTQLLECMSPELGDIVLSAFPNFTRKLIGEVITLLESLAVFPIVLGVLRSEQNAIQQDPDETFCQVTFHFYTKKSHGWNTKPHEICINCWKADHGQQQ